VTTELATLRRLVDDAGGAVHVARQLGVTHKTVYRWLSGERHLDLADARRILDLAGERWAVLDEEPDQ
jgi:DNA-binding phage protein